MYIVVPHMAAAEVSIIGNYRRGETFDLEMCFAPQRRALFLHRNFQKVLRTWREVFLAFSLSFAPQRRAIFHLSSGQLALHPPLSGAYFLTLCSHKSLDKQGESRLFYLFLRLHLLSSDSFSSLIFSLLLFSSLTLPTCDFPSVHIVGSLTSKLPSTIVISYWHEARFIGTTNFEQESSSCPKSQEPWWLKKGTPAVQDKYPKKSTTIKKNKKKLLSILSLSVLSSLPQSASQQITFISLLFYCHQAIHVTSCRGVFFGRTCTSGGRHLKMS